MIYVILGMHKSGTTLTSQILHHSGINMVDDMNASVSYDQGNQYERESTWRLNEAILGCTDVESIDIRPSAHLQLQASHRVQMQAIIRDCHQTHQGHWGFKDPRTCLTYPLWAAELPEHHIIAVYRSVDELWLRYRYKRFYNHLRDPYLAWRVVRTWSEYNLNILNYLTHTQRPFLLLKIAGFDVHPTRV